MLAPVVDDAEVVRVVSLLGVVCNVSDSVSRDSCVWYIGASAV